MKKLDIILLVLLIGLAVVLNFIPHLSYKMPLHVDEWVHFQFSNYLSNDASLYFGGEHTNLEAGFHYILATLNALGVPYVFMFVYFASIVTILICLGVFILTRKMFNERAGVFAVLFIALLQSSVMILGPVFFVPMAIGMFLIVIGLYLVELNSKAIIPVLSAILIIHPPSAMAFILLINLSWIIKKSWIKNIKYQLIAGLIAIPFYFDIFARQGASAINNLSFSVISSALFVPRELGLIITAIAIIGIYFSLVEKKYAVSVYSVALLAFILLFYHYKLEIFIPYRRALMYLFLIFAVAFGVGFDELIKLSKNKKIQIGIGIVLLAIVLIFSLPAKLESNNRIYHIISEEQYNDLVWIRENTDKNAIVLADPWIANAVTPIAERQVYSRIVQGPNEFYEARNKEISDFFKNNCSDINFLKENNIGVVYGDCSNSNVLIEVHENVWETK
ncbi:MAG: hypothetical protein WC438_00040 [Candidatus Pacearchaeota archaeon]